MSQKQWTGVDRYITDLLLPSHPALDRALQASVGSKGYGGFAIALVTVDP